MSQITTEHNGHQIVYAENEDVWRCWGMELEAKTLTALKTKLNAADAAARRVGNVKVIVLSHYGEFSMGVVTLLEGEKHAWVSPRVPGEKVLGRRSRTKVQLDERALDTPVVRDAVEAWGRAKLAYQAAAQAERDAKAAIPRATRADLAATPTGGEP